jgi:hypothetical protein
VLSGVPDSNALKVLINNLESKKQCLLSGYAVPMPLVIETRDYYGFAKQMRKRSSGDDGNGEPGPKLDLWG